MGSDKTLMNMLIVSMISADNNYDKPSRLKNLSNLKLIKERLDSFDLTYQDRVYYLNSINDGINIISKELNND